MYIPNSLLRESVTGGELHRHWAFFTGTRPCFISPDEGPALRHTLVPPTTTGNQSAADGVERSPAVPPMTTGPLPGVGPEAPPQQRAYLWVSPGFACLGEGPCFWLPLGGPQHVSLVETRAAVPGSLIGAAT